LSQPSPFVVFPSSQVSFAVTTPLPHPVGLQLLSQPSPSTALPSSQVSFAVTTPLPHLVIVQFSSQPSPSMVLPSCQASVASTRPLPQATWQTSTDWHTGSSQSAAVQSVGLMLSPQPITTTDSTAQSASATCFTELPLFCTPSVWSA